MPQAGKLGYDPKLFSGAIAAGRAQTGKPERGHVRCLALLPDHAVDGLLADRLSGYPALLAGVSQGRRAKCGACIAGRAPHNATERMT